MKKRTTNDSRVEQIFPRLILLEHLRRPGAFPFCRLTGNGLTLHSAVSRLTTPFSCLNLVSIRDCKELFELLVANAEPPWLEQRRKRKALHPILFPCLMFEFRTNQTTGLQLCFAEISYSKFCGPGFSRSMWHFPPCISTVGVSVE